jgi:hypothetical protein
MTDFKAPLDITFNRRPISDPAAFAEDAKAASWLFLCGDEFAAMDVGMSFEQVQASVAVSENIVSDPPVTFDLELAKQSLEALDRLPRPTLVTCRSWPARTRTARRSRVRTSTAQWCDRVWKRSDSRS